MLKDCVHASKATGDGCPHQDCVKVTGNFNVADNRTVPSIQANVANQTHSSRVQDIQKPITFIALNVCGLISKLVFPDLLEFVSLHDIACISESKLSKTDSIDMVGFTPFYKSRGKFRRKSGGIVVLIKNKLLPYITLFECSDNIESVDANVKHRYKFVKHRVCEHAIFFTVDKHIFGKNVLFCAVYLGPEGSPYQNRNVFYELEQTIMYLNFDSVCMLGDFNARTGSMNDLITSTIPEEDGCGQDYFYIPKRTSQDTNTNNLGKELIEFCKTFEIAIVNGRAGMDAGVGRVTCKDASVVDYVLISHKSFDLSCLRRVTIVRISLHSLLTEIFYILMRKRPMRLIISFPDSQL